MEGKVMISNVRLEPAENGIVLKWSEEYHGKTHSMSYYDSKSKVYKPGEEGRAIEDMMAKQKENEASHGAMKY